MVSRLQQAHRRLLAFVAVGSVLALSGACGPQTPRAPTQTIAHYASVVIDTTNQLARTAAGLADAHALTVAQAAPIVMACDRLDTLGAQLARGLRDYESAALAERPAKGAAIQALLADMRAILATIHVPAGQAQAVVDLLGKLAATFLQIDAIVRL